MGRVLDPLLCVFLAGIQSVGIEACMHVCVWYTGETDKTPLGQNPTGQNPTAIFGRADKTPLLHKKGLKIKFELFLKKVTTSNLKSDQYLTMYTFEATFSTCH